MARRKGTGTGTGTGKGTGADQGTGTDIIKKPKRKYTVSEAALAQRRKNGAVKHPETPEEIDYNSRLIEHTMRIYQIASQVDKKDPVSLRSAFINYIKLCQEDGFNVLNLAAYTAMGVDRHTIIHWAKSSNPEFRELAQFVRGVCSLSREQLISDQKINPVIGIFWQRNYDGLRNDTEQVQNVQEMTNNGTDDDIKTASDYKKQYGKLLEE